MRITYIQNENSASLSVGKQPESTRIFFEVDYNETVPFIEGLNAIQSYTGGVTEVEWVDNMGCLGNSFGWNGLPVGFKDTLVALYNALLSQKEAEDSQAEADMLAAQEEESEGDGA